MLREMSHTANDMAGLRAAKKQLRSLVKQTLSQLPEDSVNQQCWCFSSHLTGLRC